MESGVGAIRVMNRDALFPRNKIADGYLSYHNGGDHLARHPLLCCCCSCLVQAALTWLTAGQLELLSRYFTGAKRSDGRGTCGPSELLAKRRVWIRLKFRARCSINVIYRVFARDTRELITVVCVWRIQELFHKFYRWESSSCSTLTAFGITVTGLKQFSGFLQKRNRE